jgi:hydroxymethylpyrimidine/phosphomethylpyrimidine kinase
MTPPVALTIAGSDSGGGAGIQADLKTFAMHRVFGTSVLTAVTAQNTRSVRSIRTLDLAFVAAQLDAVLDDLPVRAVKTGMLASAATVALIGAGAARLPNLVVDPVLVSSSGAPLFPDEARRAYLTDLVPYAAVVTPNLPEAGLLLGGELSTVDDMAAAAEALAATGARCVVVKGGRLRKATEAVDVVWYGGRVELLRSPWVATANNHGTGCTFAAATAARLASGDPLPEAVRAAKAYVQRGIAAARDWRLGAGHGPIGWEATGWEPTFGAPTQPQ